MLHVGGAGSRLIPVGFALAGLRDSFSKPYLITDIDDRPFVVLISHTSDKTDGLMDTHTTLVPLKSV
jgi:hypothetical protein